MQEYSRGVKPPLCGSERQSSAQIHEPSKRKERRRRSECHRGRQRSIPFFHINRLFQPASSPRTSSRLSLRQTEECEANTCLWDKRDLGNHNFRIHYHSSFDSYCQIVQVETAPGAGTNRSNLDQLKLVEYDLKPSRYRTWQLHRKVLPH